ncbi:MAG: hypothetical protein WC325_07885 [Candidatus Bathyarchaeia archaeon]
MKHVKLVAILLCSFCLIAALLITLPFKNSNIAGSLFYFGVSFGGSTVEEAKILIDRVKNFTNLFVLQSGSIVGTGNTTAMYEIGDYAVFNNLTFAVSGDIDKNYTNSGIESEIAYSYREWIESWIDAAEQRWGDKFLGLYYADELGGKMLDQNIVVYDTENNTGITVDGKNNIYVYYNNGTNVKYSVDGNVYLNVVYTPEVRLGTLNLYFSFNDTFTQIENVPEPTEEQIYSTYPEGTTAHWGGYVYVVAVNYYVNGTVTVKDSSDDILYTSENGTEAISQYPSYSSMLDSIPIKNIEDIAQYYVNSNKYYFEWLNDLDVTFFTSDYALYWWDYLSGYDFVLAQLGWNNTVAQEIALVRGAATMQNKSWGTIITWTYNYAPYLASGDELYEQLQQSYECGAEYVVVFNYAEDMNGTYGILQDEHLEAMERFWTDVVQNSSVVNGGVKAEAVLVLPEKYGWGMRTSTDNIWGLWDADEKSEQIWKIKTELLEEYGFALDIVYDDPEFPVENRYANMFYWNHTRLEN